MPAIKILVFWGMVWTLSGLYQLVLTSFFSHRQHPSLPSSSTKVLLNKGELIYKSKCAVCHNGALTEAPRLEAMQLLSVQAIFRSLENGLMKTQGASLNKKEKRLVAEYISKVGKNKEGGNQGNCASLTKNILKSELSCWGMSLNNSRYISHPNMLINADNVSRLSLKWVFAFPAATRARTQATLAGNILFTASQHGMIYALDKASGCIKWTFQAEDEVRSAIVIGSDKNGQAERLYFGDVRANVYALDIQKQKLLWQKKADAHPLATLTGSMALHQNKLYIPLSSTEVIAAYQPSYECCTFRGSVLALDIEKGTEVWKTYLTDKPIQQGQNSAGIRKFGPSGAPVWSSPTIDPKRNLLYIGTGENYSHPATATSDAIIALQLNDGKIKWIRQTLSGDVWNGACSDPVTANCPEHPGPDYDFGAPPILIERNGQKDLLLAGQKSGMVYALDPDKEGEILWQKKVGRGGIMGGVHWGMASNGEVLFVPINDQSVYPVDKDKPSMAGIHALKVETGEILWSVMEKDRCAPDLKWVCSPGMSAAITLTPEVVYGGSLDGVLHAYSVKDGRKLWEYDTKRDYTAVNKVKAFGGTIDSTGPVISGKQLFINSGYAKFGEKAGNVLLCFELSE